MLDSSTPSSVPCREIRSNGRRLRAGLLVAMVLAALGTLRAQKQVFTPLDVAKLRSVISAHVSPNGGTVAYRVAVPKDLTAGENGGSSIELWVARGDEEPRLYTRGVKGISGLTWVPGRKALSFVDQRGDDKKGSLYVLPILGGEAQRVLSHASGIGKYSWSADGKRIAFLSIAAVDSDLKGLQDKGFNQIVYEEDWRPSELWVAGISAHGDSTAARRIDVEGSVSAVYWSPTAERLAIEVAPTPLVDDSYMQRRLRIVQVDSGQTLKRIDNPGKLGTVHWSPDGKYLGIISAEDPNDPKEGRLWVTEIEAAATGKDAFRDLLPGLEGHVSDFVWTSADKLVAIVDVGCETRIDELGVGGEKSTLIDLGEVIFTALSSNSAGDRLAFVAETSKHPSEAFRWSPGGEGLKRLSDTNPWLAERRFAEQEVVRHRARDGLELEGVLIRPLDHIEGQRVPLILTVHGGPEAHMRNGWLTRYSYAGQVGAARGFAVFYPNYRGSTGRGVAFSKTSQADAAGKEFDDLIDAVDHLVEVGLVDKDRVGITGGSYGGYASAWGATFYSHRFAASVMFVGISDNISKVGTTDIPIEMHDVHHLKYLWEDWDYFKERSPIFHVQKNQTPTLILHGKDDPRVHPSQSLELFRHLKVLDQAPVRLILYPGEGHGNRKAAARYDYNLRMLRWFERYLQGAGGEAPDWRIDYGLPAGGKPKERVASRRI